MRNPAERIAPTGDPSLPDYLSALIQQKSETNVLLQQINQATWTIAVLMLAAVGLLGWLVYASI